MSDKENEHKAREYLETIYDHVICVRKGESAADAAIAILRREYYTKIKVLAEYIKHEINCGEIDNAEFLDSCIFEKLEGHYNVIYTHAAKIVCFVSDNADVGMEEELIDPVTFKTGIPWSILAFWAMRTDLVEQLEAINVDLNDPKPDYRFGKVLEGTNSVCEDCLSVEEKPHHIGKNLLHDTCFKCSRCEDTLVVPQGEK